jgi:hypothetical protein
MMGTSTPASEATWRAYMPAASTTTSHSIRPLSVSTADTRPPVVSMPVTCVRTSICAPRRRAPSASAKVSCEGSR